MPLASRKRTFKRPRAGKIKPKTVAQDIKIKEIKTDIELSNFSEQLLEKTEKFISNKTSHKYGKIKIKVTSTETRPGSFQLKSLKPKSFKNKSTQKLPPIIEIPDSKSNFEPETLKNFNSSENIAPSIEIINISSDTGSETETEESIFAYNKNFLPRITNIRNLGQNKVSLIREF